MADELVQRPGYTKFGFRQLNDTNYLHWKEKMSLQLENMCLLKHITESRPETPTPQWLNDDSKARTTIALCLDDSQMKNIRGLKTTHEVWKALQDEHAEAFTTARFQQLRLLFNIKWRSGTVQEYIAHMRDILHGLAEAGQEVPDDIATCCILSGMPDSWGPFVSTIEAGAQDVSLAVVCQRLKAEGKRLLGVPTDFFRASDGVETANYSKPNRRAGAGKDGGKKYDDHKRNTGGGGKKKETRSCFTCGKRGHLSAACRERKDRLSRDEGVYLANQDDVRQQVVQTIEISRKVSTEAGLRASEFVWCVDSGATSHMTSCRKFFTRGFRATTSSMRCADGRRTNIHGIGGGTISCRTPSGHVQQFQLDHVLFVPSLEENLFSVKKALKDGIKVDFDDEVAYLFWRDQAGIDHLRVEARGESGLYRLHVLPDGEAVNVARVTGTLECWHRRFGHRDKAAINKMFREQMVTGLEITAGVDSHHVLCENCVRGKLASKSFPSSESKSEKPIDLVHTDLCGPMQVASAGGNRYVLTFVDDFSKFTAVRFLRQKSQVAVAIKEYVASMNTKFERHVKVIRSDNGREYVNNEVRNHLASIGIRHEYTVVYTPQQNGVAERKNRSLIEMARCLLLDAKLPKRYWADAVLWANYLQNRLPTASVECTPYELYEGVKPDVSHIRVFGSRAFSLIPNQKRRKLDDRAREGVLIGYGENVKGYRLLDVASGAVWCSHTVRFDESSAAAQPDAAKVPEPEGEWHPVMDDESYVEEVEHPTTITDTPQLQDDTSIDEGVVYDDGNVDDEPPTPPAVIPKRRGRPPKSTTEPVPMVATRHSTRSTAGQPPDRLGMFAGVTDEVEPVDWAEVQQLPSRERVQWERAAEEEMTSLREHHVWELVNLPTGRKAISCKWIFKAKTDADGRIHTHKARLVARGYTQKFGQDFDETYAPVVRHDTVRVLLSVAAVKKLHVRQLDVKSAYLNGVLEEELYMEQPPGFVVAGQDDKVCRLRKSLYGLKQSARAWNAKAVDVLRKLGFRQSEADACLFVKTEAKGSKTMYILLYVDDLLVAGESANVTRKVGQQLHEYFEVRDLGEVSSYLGIKVERSENGDFLLSQRAKIIHMCRTHGLQEPKSVRTPMETGFLSMSTESSPALPNNNEYRQAVGSLLYIATVSRPDVSAAVGFLARRVENPKQADWRSVKRVMRYLSCTSDRKLKLSADGGVNLTCYVDADWAGDHRDRKSTSGYVFRIGDSTVAWCSRKQSMVATSSTEAEYVAASHAAKELLWLRQLLFDMKMLTKNVATTVYEDNQACIKLIESDRCGARTKHIDVCYHQLRDLREKGIIAVQYCSSEQMMADILTKPLGKIKFNEMVDMLGIEN